MRQTDRIRIVIVDDHRMVREGLRSMLREQPTIDIVGEAENEDQALEIIATHDPEVVLLDIRLRGASGLDVCRNIHERFPKTNVIFLTVYEDQQYVFEALRAGARGYVLKKIGDEELVKVIEAVRDGEVIVDASLGGVIAQQAAEGAGPWAGARYGLSEREGEVLEAIAQGLSNHKAGELLFISEETVKTHMRSILRKLGVSDRTQAVSLAIREGLIR